MTIDKQARDAAQGALFNMPAAADDAVVPLYVRSTGGVRVRFGCRDGRTKLLDRRESDGFRVRLPRTGHRCEAVLINTGGGLAGGDRMTLDLAVDPDTHAVVTTQAAEKVYRAQSAPTEVAVDMRLAANAQLEWLPQETILFSGSQFRRRLTAAVDATAALTIAESTVFGRVASGETMGEGLFHDSWRISRDGRPVFADDVRLTGNISDALLPRAAANGARAIATVLYLAADAEARLDEARALLAAMASGYGRCEGGASAWNGMLVVRLLARDPQELRRRLVGLLEKFRHAPMPRSW